MIGLLGLLAGLGLLIWLALRDVNIIFAAVLCALVVIVSNGLPFAESLTQSFTVGELGAFTFAGRFFLLFAAGSDVAGRQLRTLAVESTDLASIVELRNQLGLGTAENTSYPRALKQVLSQTGD